MRIYHAKPEQLDRVWPLAEPWLRHSHNRGANLEDLDILPSLEAGTSHLLLLRSPPAFAWMVLGVCKAGEHKVALVEHLAGKGALGLLDQVADYVEAYARHNGCRYVEIEGRPGWDRKLVKYGLREVRRVYRSQELR